jgi:hypothetical protein
MKSALNQDPKAGLRGLGFNLRFTVAVEVDVPKVSVSRVGRFVGR